MSPDRRYAPGTRQPHPACLPLGVPMSRRCCLVALVLVFRGVAAPACAAEPTRHLFLDPAFVRDAHGAALRVNRPQQRRLVIRPDRPWEKLMITFFLTVHDEPSPKG